MDNRYKIILSNNNIYKEIELTADTQQVKVGTGIDCDIRLRKELFFGQIELLFVKNGNQWAVHCSDNLYLTVGDVRKLMTKTLYHGDYLEVKYQDSNIIAFSLDFLIDFDDGKRKYERIVDICNVSSITIGSNFNSTIVLGGEFVKGDSVLLNKEGSSFVVDVKHSTYGVYINGKKAKDKDVINDGDFLSISDFFFYFKSGCVWTQVRQDMTINNLNYIDKCEKQSYPKFNLNTRIKTVLNEEKIEILDPPKKPTKPEGNIFVQLMPALMMIVLTVVVRGFMSDSNNSSFLIFSICSMSLGVFTTVFSMVSQQKKYKQDIKNRIKKYNAYVDFKRKEISAFRIDEVNRLNDIHINTEREIANVENFDGDLFDKTSKDEDFLHVRIGKGSIEAKRKINFKIKENFESDDDLAAIPEQIYKEYKKIDGAPIIMNCKDDGVVGVVGAPNSTYELAKKIVVDLATRHYYRDVKFFFLINEDKINQYYEWVRWIPHMYSENSWFRNIIYNDETKAQIFEYLYVELGKRAQTKSKETILPHYVIFVMEDWGIKTHPVSQYIENASVLGATFIFFEDKKEKLPVGCKEIVFLDEKTGSGHIISSARKDEKIYFDFDVVDNNKLNEIAIRLAPVYCEEISLENALTKNITLYELFNIMSADDLDLTERWEKSQVFKTMAAPLGVKTKNEIVYLDLHEKAHGPHGLVAGTTGSGKSELLQTYILSMATLFHPYEVGFVVIDFKGGGMVNQFRNLPHLIGAITNIDGREINRSLMSIKAELEKRQRLFAENGVNNINSYIKQFKDGKITIPIPHLIIVVDEFAELKAEQPEFMKELISAARIGRSLGVHLILATQKPAGQVNEQIWSNSKFKLCLKVQNKEDSNEVLKSPLAAEIKEPGRAYLQVGNNEIFELFQSAYSGAPARSDEATAGKEFKISEVALSGKRKIVFQQKISKSNKVVETQLDAIVEYVNSYCTANNITKLPSICLPPLEDVITYPKLKTTNNNYLTIPFGVYDDPSHQLQDVVSIDFSTGNVAIIGSSQYGKTNLLQLIIRYIGETYTPKEVSIYVLDFGSMALKVFDSMNHVGGVVTASDDEKIKNFFRMMLKEIKKRKEKFSSLGITSFHSYKEAGYTDLPQIVVAIDNFIAFKELYSEYEDDMLSLCREGVSLGICLVMTSLQTNGISYKYMSNFSNKICLFCNSNDEYGSMFDRCRIQPKAVPGRGLVQIENLVYEFQSYLAFEGEREIDRVVSIKSFIDGVNDANVGELAKKIPSIPAVLDKDYVSANYTSSKAYSLPIGIDYDTVEFVSLDLAKESTIAISGRESSGKTNWISLIMNYCQLNVFDYAVKAYLVDSYEKQLEQFSSYGFVEKYTIDVGELENIFAKLEEELKSRKENVQIGGIEVLKDEPLLLCVIENRGIFESNCLSKQAIESYKRIINNYKQFKVLIVFSNVPNVGTGYGAPDMLKLIKDVNEYYIFDDLTNVKLLDFNAATLRQYKKPIELGDAYKITSDGSINKIRTIHNVGRED